MAKFVAVFLGLFAVSNAQLLPGGGLFSGGGGGGLLSGLLPGLNRPSGIFSGINRPTGLIPGIISSLTPGPYAGVLPTYPGVIRSVIPEPIVPLATPILSTVIPATELNEWETFKTKFGKVYSGIEDMYRFGIYYANKLKVAKFDELIYFGVGDKQLTLNSFADFTRDELFNLRAHVETDLDEWISFKETHGKKYDDFEDQFRKTVYFITKDAIEAHNKLVDAGFITPHLEVNEFTDLFHYELPSTAPVLPSATTILSSPAAASVPIARAYYI